MNEDRDLGRLLFMLENDGYNISDITLSHSLIIEDMEGNICEAKVYYSFKSGEKVVEIKNEEGESFVQPIDETHSILYKLSNLFKYNIDKEEG